MDGGDAHIGVTGIPNSSSRFPCAWNSCWSILAHAWNSGAGLAVLLMSARCSTADTSESCVLWGYPSAPSREWLALTTTGDWDLPRGGGALRESPA